MIRFYFDSFDGDRLIVDQEGLEFSSTSLMRDAAIAALPDMARDERPDGDRRLFWIHVRDAQGARILEATLTLDARWIASSTSSNS
jgi:hypothetical protein